MTSQQRGPSRGLFRTLFDAGAVAGLTDGQLLERFATRRNEGAELAFAALVDRHGPMVLRACRGILRDDHEAMDAFQATFLVLARKGGSLWVRDSLGPWLHRVACHAAGRARSAAARRRAVETRAAAESAAARAGGDDERDLASLVHEEVDRLPERYRSTVILCDLEGRTCEEAARHLGCPVGTVGSRLARGRQRLRDRLRRRGLAPGDGLFAGAARWPGPVASAPPGLVAETAAAAAQFVSTRAGTLESAATLALGVYRSMLITRWCHAASLLLTLAASTAGVVTLAGGAAAVGEAQPDDAPKAARADGGAGFEVKRGEFKVVLEERGSLEAANVADVYCDVKGQTTILSILPEGTKVKKGQIVCELDTAALKDALTNQVFSIQAAERALDFAELNREVAEIAQKEYAEGIYPKDHQAASTEIALARSSISKAEERLKRTRAARERLNALLVGQGGTKSPADVVADLEVEDRLAAAEQAVDRGRGELEAGQDKLQVLQKFTKEKTVKQLRIECHTARTAELARRSTLGLEKMRLDKLQGRIAACTVRAPVDGTVVYANEPNRFGSQPRPQIEEGSTVQERQKIFSIHEVDGPYRVAAKVQELMIGQVTRGQTARVKVDAFPGETFAGVVEDVAPLPDPSTFFNDGGKVYTTRLSITKGRPGLRPGMTAKVEILVANLDDAISVPVGAVVRYDDKDHVAVKTAGGGVEWRDVTLGLTNGKAVEVKEGLKVGESVAPEAGPHLSEDQKRKIAASPPKPVPKPGTSLKGTLLPKPQSKGLHLPPEIRAKIQAILPEDRAKLRAARPEDREALFEALLKKAGLTDDEIRQYNQTRKQAATPP